jgi:DNA transformation protein and related proteins
MAVSSNFLQYVLEQLAPVGGISSRKMFGGIGLYCDNLFFGLIDDDTLFFKVNDSNRGDYESRGMTPFQPSKDRPEVSMSYFTVPPDVLEDSQQLTVWAQKSVAAAAVAPNRRKKR